MSDFVYRYVPGERPETLLLLHGTGGDENDLLDLGAAVFPGANLLSPRGKVIEGGMPRFFRRFAEGVFDEEDLKARAAELAGFVQEKASEHGFDPARVIPLGYSNGANIAGGMLLTGAMRFPKSVLLRAMVPLTPAAPADLAGAKVLLAQGALDPLGNPDQTERLRGLLDAAGAAVTVHSARGGHQLTQGDIEAAASWLAAQ